MTQYNQKGRGIARHAFVNTRMRGKLDIDIEEKGRPWKREEGKIMQCASEAWRSFRKKTFSASAGPLDQGWELSFEPQRDDGTHK